MDYQRNKYSWLSDTVRVEKEKLLEIQSALDDIYFMLEDSIAVLAEANRTRSTNRKEIQDKVWLALEKMESLRDTGISELDRVTSDMKYEFSRLQDIDFELNITRRN